MIPNMKPGPVNLNGQLLSALPEPLAEAQRAMYYADGLFETIRVFDGQAPNWPDHWQRLSRGFELLGFTPPVIWSESFFKTEIKRIMHPNARIRLMVWRSPGGFYLPTQHHPQFLITSEPIASGRYEWVEQGLGMSLCNSVQLPVDTLSGLKMLGGTRYIAAAREARMKGQDDGLLLNSLGNIAEATSSNVFWIKNGEVFTPAPGEGQVKGILQGRLSSILQTKGWKLHEKCVTPEELLDADELFLTNAIQGIRWVREFENVPYGYEITKHLYQLLNQELEFKKAEKSWV